MGITPCCAKATAQRHMERHGLPLPPIGRNGIGLCDHCGQSFQIPNQRHCSAECRKSDTKHILAHR